MNNLLIKGRMGELLKIARHTVEKSAAVDAATLMGGGQAAAGGDPMAAAGGDPMAAAGGDPMAAAGGAPPGGGGGGMTPDEVIAIVQSVMAQQPAGGAAGGGVEPIKPKIDVNVEIMQMKKMLAKLLDAQGIVMPATDMVATQDDLTQMGMQSEAGGAGGEAGAAPQSAIAPPDPMAAASPALAQGGKVASMLDGGTAYESGGILKMTSKAAAMAKLMSRAG